MCKKLIKTNNLINNKNNNKMKSKIKKINKQDSNNKISEI